jgi:hypothetical protein
MAPTREEAEQSAARIERAFADVPVSQVLASELLAAGHRRGILFTTTPRGSSVSAAAEAVLEIGSPRVSLTSKSTGQLSVASEWSPAGEWSPDFRLRIVVDVTLAWVTGGDETRRWSWWWTHEGEVAAPFWDWSRGDARVFRNELERALHALALRAVNELLPPSTQASDPPVSGPRAD